jgi:hypothetical protein
MIKEIWDELLGTSDSRGNIIIRRYSVNSIPEIYIAIRRSTGEKGFALSVDASIELNLSRYDSFKDIRIEKFPDEFKERNNLILILLSNQRDDEVFETLCLDLIEDLGSINNESHQVRELFNRLEKWKSLFEMADEEGLNAEAQRGLFGELYFLRNWLNNSTNHSRCIKSWLGPDKAIRDFQLMDWAIEVKTTFGNNHQKLAIANERQLDSTALHTLILFHLSLERQQENGETLNQLISSVKSLLFNDYLTLIQFKAKLLLAGYFDNHVSLYENSGYLIRQASYYHVRDNFPRIEEMDIRPGVGEVKYTIIISDQVSYNINEDYVFEIIN